MQVQVAVLHDTPAEDAPLASTACTSQETSGHAHGSRASGSVGVRSAVLDGLLRLAQVGSIHTCAHVVHQARPHIEILDQNVEGVLMLRRGRESCASRHTERSLGSGGGAQLPNTTPHASPSGTRCPAAPARPSVLQRSGEGGGRDWIAANGTTSHMFKHPTIPFHASAPSSPSNQVGSSWGFGLLFFLVLLTSIRMSVTVREVDPATGWTPPPPATCREARVGTAAGLPRGGLGSGNHAVPRTLTGYSHRIVRVDCADVLDPAVPHADDVHAVPPLFLR